MKKNIYFLKSIAGLLIIGALLAIIMSQLNRKLDSNDDRFKTAGLVSGFYVTSPPLVDKNGNIYFGAKDNKLYSASKDGEIKWAVDTRGIVMDQPLLRDNTIYFTSVENSVLYGRGTIYAVTIDGKKKWSFTSPGPINFSGAISKDDIVYFTSANGSVYAVDPTGSVKWEYKINDFTAAPILAENGEIFFSDGEGWLYKVNSRGNIEKLFKADGAIDYLAGKKNLLYAGTRKGEVYALAQNGEIRWKTRLSHGRIMFVKAGDDNNVYVGTASLFGIRWWIYAFKASGKVRWEAQIGWLVQDIAIDKNGNAYINTAPILKTGAVRMINPNGDINLIHEARGLTTAPAVNASGIYIGKRDGIIRKSISHQKGR